MKKIKLFALALMATFSLSAMAETETVAKSSDNWTGTSISILNAECANGSADAKKDGDANNVTYIKFRTNKNGNTIKLFVNDGYELTGLYLRAYTNDNSTAAILNSVQFDDDAAITLDATLPTGTSKTEGSTYTYDNQSIDVDSIITLQFNNSGKQIMAVITVTYQLIPTCEEPTAGELTISSDAPAILYEGTTVNFTVNGGHGSGRGISLDGDGSWMGWLTGWSAVAGRHVIRVSEPQWEDTESGVTYCAGEDSVVLNVLAATPVTECTIAGEATGYIGSQLTYTATAANATDYEWYVDGVAANTNSATFVYTANALGSHEIKATASNQYTTTPVESNVINLNVTPLYGELIKATLTSGTAATVTGIIGGTADVSLSSSKKMDKGKYFGIQLAEGNFMEGDTVVITLTTKGSNYPCLFADKERTNCLFLATEVSEDLVYKIELPAAANNVNTLYVSRGDESDGYKWNPVLSSMAVIRPLDDGSPVLKASQTAIELAVTAEEPNPSVVVNFSGKHLTPGSYGIVVPNLAGLTVAPASVTVGDDGKLDAAIAISYESADDVAANATSVSLTIDAIEVVVGISYSATHAKTYLSANVNIEQAVLDHGTKYDIKSDITAAGWTFENLNDLDTLNDLENKTNRNEAFLGLKVKAANAYIAGWLQADGILLVKFGNLGSSIKVNVTGATTNDEQTFTAEDLAANGNVLPIYGYTEDVYVKISTVTGGTVVLKQLMLDDIAEVTLPAPSAYLASVAAGIENGTVTLSWPNKKYRTPVGETVTVTVTPNDGFEIDQVTVGDAILLPEGGVYSFEMPAQDVEVAASFKAGATALDEAAGEVKARKIVRDGQIIIVRGDKEFNIVGAEL